jgi:hypothetical protein
MSWRCVLVKVMNYFFFNGFGYILGDFFTNASGHHDYMVHMYISMIPFSLGSWIGDVRRVPAVPSRRSCRRYPARRSSSGKCSCRTRRGWRWSRTFCRISWRPGIEFLNLYYP